MQSTCFSLWTQSIPCLMLVEGRKHPVVLWGSSMGQLHLVPSRPKYALGQWISWENSVMRETVATAILRSYCDATSLGLCVPALPWHHPPLRLWRVLGRPEQSWTFCFGLMRPLFPPPSAAPVSAGDSLGRRHLGSSPVRQENRIQ
ncbi:hypothetical protein GDO81_025520 [Engystomops pustulosus]|uniref:Uncharacterized protein n=1 Tax=Engystomops pustulosus TaxID=76066 RepID=A0AAV6ZN25_ENGPU|nr:hypothetical protein GDO81_025520 [Engystomops pustulosus]